ncbi:MAG TPA: MFS transporter [Ktedonobacterales bacterium]
MAHSNLNSVEPGAPDNSSLLRGDTLRITAMRGLRQVAYGMMAVILAIALTRAGLSAIAIGLLVSVSLAGDLFGTLVIGRWADHWGRRRTLTVLALLMTVTGLIFGLAGLFNLARWYPVLLVAAFFGTLGTSASETAPFLPIEQAMLGQAGKSQDRTRRFAGYNFVAVFAGALGALIAGLPDLALRYGVPMPVSLEFSFALYAVVALVVALLASRLSSAVEAPTVAQSMPLPVGARAVVSRDDPPHKMRPRLFPSLPHSRRVVLQLSSLFSLDAFAGGLVAQTLMALFFHLRFGVSLGLLAVLFFGANLLSALSFLAAPALARRFGLLNTMVFTHLPSNLLLILVPLMPTFVLAAALLLLRQTLSQLDIPTRQSYTMALVTPEERTAAASATSVARSAGAATSPALAGVLLQGSFLVFGAPFLIAGGLKATYDLSLWALFRRVRLPGN